MVLRRIKKIGQLAHGALKRRLAQRRRKKEKRMGPKPKPIDPAVKFAIRQIGFQSTYFPELTMVHNRLLRQCDFHHGTKVLKITGEQNADTRLMRNMEHMMALEAQINELRMQSRKNRRGESDALIDQATGLEHRFSGLKAENLKIFSRFFAKK